MNNTQLIIIVFIIINCAGIVHIIVAKYNYFPILNIPIHMGWFGSNKTWRGVLMMGLVGLIVGFLLTQSLLGLWLGLAYVIGELPNSYIKRKLHIKPGKLIKGGGALIQYLGDMMDSVIIIGLLLVVGYEVDGLGFIALLLIGIINHILIDRASRKTKHLPNIRLIITQSLSYLIYTCRYPHRRKNTMIYNGRPLIIISNHISQLDPFIILGSIPWGVFRRILPIRIMIKPKILHHKRWGPLLYIVGGYCSYIPDSSKNNTSIARSLQYLSRGESLMIFPQGGIDEQSPGVGAWHINKNLTGSKLMLFTIIQEPEIASIYKGTIQHNYIKQDLAHYYHQDMQHILT